MNILLIGGGGREHALAWAIAASPLTGRLFAAPGNPGVAQSAEIIDLAIDDHPAVVQFATDNAIDLVVVGPEAPLCAGLADVLTHAGIQTFGPSKAAAQLEGSKAFTKQIARDNDIPTASFACFTDRDQALAHLEARGAPLVVKADGLAAGKGVTVCEQRGEAREAIEAIFDGAFGPGASLVIEDMLVGEEASFFALIDGENILPLASAQDHKRALDGDLGPNTGGMGAYSPAPVMTDEMVGRVMDRIVEPTAAAMARAGTPYRGVLYAGLMITEKGPELIEYNVRFGDPEAQVLMMRLGSDILPALAASANGDLGNMKLSWRDDAALTVVVAANGYPGSYNTGEEIGGLDQAGALEGVQVFHAGTRMADGKIVSAGGRVLNVTARAPTIAEAQARAYRAVDLIDWPGGFCRRDIGWRAIARDQVSAN
ncbi:MAG: phosphoribosylamine--glycine ligase [Rhizobiales bacterium]|nr:phosphoribosylamine--glycine ligase [Hyphomicrobiales bacterium]